MPRVVPQVMRSMSAEERFAGWNRRLKVRFKPGVECQVWVPCPRPAVCSLAASTDKLSKAPEASLRALFVDSVLSSHLMAGAFWLGFIFVVYLSANLSQRCLKNKTINANRVYVWFA